MSCALSHVLTFSSILSFLQVSEGTTLGEIEEAIPFAFVLVEEIVTPMMVDEPQTYEEPPPTHVFDGILGELEPKGTMPKEAGRGACAGRQGGGA